MIPRFSILIPTKNRCSIFTKLLGSLKGLHGLERIRPEVIVGDNNSTDQTREILQRESGRFPVPLNVLKVHKPGKCAVLNEAIRAATGDILAFLDDDVVLDPTWLEGVEKFFQKDDGFLAGQGVIRIPSPDAEDATIRKLIQRYRTIPNVDFQDEFKELHSLNGANIAIRRELFDRIGSLDERLGPGASGTSEDVEFAQRILHGGMKIGYMANAIVYHQVDPSRLTERYFKSLHRRQGRSRLLFNKPSIGRILFDLIRASVQYGFYSLIRNERKKYRGKGRVYHYLEMLSVKCQRRQRTAIRGTGFTGKNRVLL